MLDQYRTLSVALRRPMGRWWRRVGLWWMAGIALLALAEGASRGYIVPWLEAASKTASAGSGMLSIAHFLGVAPWAWLGFSDVLLSLGRLLTICACLLAGVQALRLSLELQREFPHPVPGATRRLCYLQSLAAGWPFMLLWLIIGSSVFTFTLCSITGRHDTLPGNQALCAELYPTAGMGEPWSTLVSIVLLLALANTCAKAQLPAWLWALALGCTPLVQSIRAIVLMLPLPRSVSRMAPFTRFADLPQLELGLGWILGGCFLLVLFVLYRRKQLVWASILLAVLLVSSVLSGFGSEVPLVHNQRIKRNLDQIGASSPLGLTLVFVRSLSDFPRSAVVTYQPFGRQEFSWGSWEEESPNGKAGALKSSVPVPWFVPTPAWGRFTVAPLNLLYLALLVSAVTLFLYGEPPVKARPPCILQQRAQGGNG